jgi:hypothetical protein
VSVAASWLNRTVRTIRTFAWPAVPTRGVLKLAAAADDDAVSRIFDWERERVATLSKGLAGTATAVAVAAFAAAFQDKTFDSPTTIWWIVLAIAVMLTWSAVLAVGVQSLGDQYAIATVAVHEP